MLLSPLVLSRLGLIAAALLVGHGAGALTLALPETAEETASETRPPAQATFPAAPWRDEATPTITAEGTLLRTAWRFDARDRTLLQILAPLRAQIEAAGYEVVFDCASDGCGGFDFRFATNALDAPQMYVDLANYFYLLARNGDDLASLMISRAGATGFVQLTRLVPAEAAPAAPPRQPVAAAPETLWDDLVRDGHAPLDDLLFRSGSAQLDGDRFASLDALAQRMERDSDLRLRLVGHTDTSGGLATNIALSRRRAEAVRRVMVESYGADPDRIEAEGVGALAPRGSNATPEGRTANRRVEVVLP